MITRNTASRLKLRHTETVTLRYEGKELVASPIVVQESIIPDDIIGMSERDASWLNAKDESMISVLARKTPQSYDLIKRKIRDHQPWNEGEVRNIVYDISNKKYTSIEVATFALVSQFRGYEDNELKSFSVAMAEAGTQFDFKEPTFDKHSIGGIPGNKITPIIVPIVAAAGLLIPKTSSRAITSPSGTADTMEVVCDVSFTAEEIMELAPKSRGMIVWNGGLNLSPLDDIAIEVKRQLGIDPKDQMLASIVSTKIAMGVRNLVFDIPTGEGSKMPSRTEAIEFAHRLIGLCRSLGIKVEAALTIGDLPLGNNIGPALEIKEALSVLENNGPQNVREKSTDIAGILLELGGMAKPGKGAIIATEYIESGKALSKFKEIVEIQGGDPNITSNSIPVSDYNLTVTAPIDGYVIKIDNHSINSISKAAGCPKDKLAGLILHVRRGEFVNEGDKLFTIYASSESKLSLASQLAVSQPICIIEGMVITRISSMSERNI